jgi:hypothetical protein
MMARRETAWQSYNEASGVLNQRFELQSCSLLPPCCAHFLFVFLLLWFGRQVDLYKVDGQPGKESKALAQQKLVLEV